MADSVDITVKDAEVRRSLDVLTKGASTAFLDGARAVLLPIMEEAKRNSPEDDGTFADAFELRQSVSETHLAVSIYNGTSYGRFVRWSVRTEASLKAEAKRRSEEQRPNSVKAAEALEALLLNPNVPKTLAWWHGSGTVEESFTGRNVFAEIRRVGRREARKFIDMQQDVLTALAGGA